MVLKKQWWWDWLLLFADPQDEQLKLENECMKHERNLKILENKLKNHEDNIQAMKSDLAQREEELQVTTAVLKLSVNWSHTFEAILTTLCLIPHTQLFHVSYAKLAVSKLTHREDLPPPEHRGVFSQMSPDSHMWWQEYVAKASEISPERQQVTGSTKSIDTEITRLKKRIKVYESSHGQHEQVVRWEVVCDSSLHDRVTVIFLKSDKNVSLPLRGSAHPSGFLLRTDSLSLLSKSIQSARWPSLNHLLALFWKKTNWGDAVFCPLSSLGSTPRPSRCTDRKPTKWEICAGSSIDSTTSCQTGRTDTK